MPHYRVTFELGSRIFGGSESYVSKVFTGEAHIAAIQQLINARNNMLLPGVYWQGVEIAEVGARRKSVYLPPGTYTPFGTQSIVIPESGKFEAAAGIVGSDPDQWRSALQVTTTFNGGYRSQRYLLGVPDAVIKGEGFAGTGPTATGWRDLFDVFANVVLNGNWGVYARDRSGDVPVAPVLRWRMRDTAPSLLGAEVLPSSWAIPPGIRFVSVQNVRRKGTDKLSYNGRYLIDSIVAGVPPLPTIIYLSGTETADAASIKLPGDIQAIRYVFAAFEGYRLIRAVVHKRGGPSRTPLGRRKTRVSLDP